MLAAVQNATEVEAWMPATPIWHAPVLAAAIAGYAVAVEGPEGWRIPAAVVAGIALLVGLVDQIRRQRISPRRMRKPLRLVAFYGFMLVVIAAIAGLWFSIDWSANLGMQLLTLVGGWLATTAAFAVGISTTDRMRNHWSGSDR